MLTIRSLVQAGVAQTRITCSRLGTGFSGPWLRGSSRTFQFRALEHLAAIRNWRRQRRRRHIKAKQFAQATTQLVDAEVALDLAGNRQADAARLLGNDHGDGVSFLGYANTRAMPRA